MYGAHEVENESNFWVEVPQTHKTVFVFICREFDLNLRFPTRRHTHLHLCKIHPTSTTALSWLSQHMHSGSNLDAPSYPSFDQTSIAMPNDTNFVSLSGLPQADANYAKVFHSVFDCF